MWGSHTQSMCLSPVIHSPSLELPFCHINDEDIELPHTPQGYSMTKEHLDV